MFPCVSVCTCVIYVCAHVCAYTGFPGGSDGKESTCNAETQVPSLGQEDPLEKGMPAHSSILAWKTPMDREPGRLKSMGLHRIGHDLMTEQTKQKCVGI